MSKRLFVLLVVLAAALASARDKAENWIQVSSPHFTVISNSNEKQARRIAGQFERMRSMFHAAFPQLQVDPAHPIVVLAVRDKDQFRMLEPQAYLANESLHLNGLFLRASDQNYVLIRIEPEGQHPYAIVYHEYTHWLLSRAPNLPLWFDEGMAEFYDTAQIFERDSSIGAANERDLMLLRQTPLLPFETLFTIDETSPYYREKKKGSIFYAESWALTHYLYFHDFDYKTSRVNDYMDLLSQNVDPVVAATRAFGDLKELQAALEHYIQQGTFHRYRNAAIAPVDDLAFDVEAMTPAKVSAVKASVLAYNGRTSEARALLADVLQQDPGNASARQTTAFLDSLEQREAEDKLRDNIHSSPLSASGYDRLASFLWNRNRNLEEARTLESKALSLESGNVEYRIHMSKILLALGRGQDAVDVLREAAKLARTPAERDAVNNLLRDAQGYAEAQAEERRIAAELKAPEKTGAGLAAGHEGDTFVAGPHRYLVGVLKDVHCESARMDLTLDAGSKRIELHAENYYKVEYSVLNLPPLNELNPCEQLEGRPARVEYVESADGSDVARVLAVELHK
jgi:tetratricopeptide (TPR) repeat protein